MSRPSNTEQRRAQIADGLIRVMAQRGIDGATIADIAGAAGLTPGLVHYHFKSKQQILLLALERLVARHDARLRERLREAADPAGEIAAFIEVHLRLGGDPEALACWIVLSGEALRNAEVRAAYREAVAGWMELLAGALRRGVDDGAFRDVDAAAAASAIVATIQGYFVLAATARDLVPRGTAAESALRMTEGLIGAPLPRPEPA